jgi:hypothetical protein
MNILDMGLDAQGMERLQGTKKPPEKAVWALQKVKFGLGT